MAEGKINQVIGPVVDVEFAPQELPSIANALSIEREGQTSLIVEVAQHLGDNVVRCVAMETTDGLVRGMKVQDTGDTITVPVGLSTLGRLFDVLGRPIDNLGPVDAE